MRKRVTWHEFAALAAVLLITQQIMVLLDENASSDIIFLYNRAGQMLGCLRDGNLPFFYYNDFNGVGYGSAFFYGHLTLYPFLVFVGHGLGSFTAAYAISCFVLTYFGVMSFAGKFTDKSKEVALLYLGSTFMVLITLTTGLLVNSFGCALAFFFLSHCVGFFRDGRPVWPAVVLWWLVAGTHTVTALVAFVLCVALFVAYYDKARWKGYLLFAAACAAVSAYAAANMAYHMETLRSVTDFGFKDGYFTVKAPYMDPILYGGVVARMLMSLSGVDGYGFRHLNIFVAAVCLGAAALGVRTLSRKERLFLAAYAALSAAGIPGVWNWLNCRIPLPIQFPCRYTPYMVAALLVVGLRRIGRRWAVVLCLLSCVPDVLVTGMFIGFPDKVERPWYSNQVVNGEYLTGGFVFDSDVFEKLAVTLTDSNGMVYEYSEEGNTLYVDVPEGGVTLRFPKLWYRGYRLWDDSTGDTVDTRQGYSQFIEADVGHAGRYALRYVHPWWLVALDAFGFAAALFALWRWIYGSKGKKRADCGGPAFL